MRLKEIPTTYREYYQTFHDAYAQKCDDTIKDIERLNIMINSIKDSIENKYELFKTKCKIDLHDYPEYISNKYDNGILDKDVKELFMKHSNNYELKVFILILKRFVNSIKNVTELNKKLQIYQKCRNITVKEYRNLLERYFTEVHKYIILDGYGYQLSPAIGVICFNRCKLVNARPKIDYKATKERKKALLDSGERLFDKDEAEFCKQNDIEYNGKDYRVFMNKDYVYEMPLLFGKFPNCTRSKFYITDRRSRQVRGKSNEDLIRECNNDTKEIVKLPLDMRTKLTMCLSVDKMLYSKFIRNENQKPIATTKAYR